MEELTGLNRRYAHLHTPKHLTNPDHLNRVIPSTAAPGRPGLPLRRDAAGLRRHAHRGPVPPPGACVGPLRPLVCARVDHRRMSDEPDPSAVAAQWEEIAPGIDKMAQRTADPDDFPISPGSSLAGDDKASRPYQVSHAARMCLVAGVDHLHAAKALLLDLHVLHVAAQFSLVRGSLENLSAAFWILHPTERDERIERTLRWHAQNFKEQHFALGPIGLSDEAKRDAKLAKLDSVAATRGISTKKVREGYRSSRAVRYAGVRYAEKYSTRSELLLLHWQFCSGYAHGRPWAYLGMSEQEFFETTDPGVLNVKLTTDPSRLLYPTLAAFQLMNDVVELMQQRSLPAVSGKHSSASPRPRVDSRLSPSALWVSYFGAWGR